MRGSGGIIVKIANLFRGRSGRFSRKIGVGGFTLLELWIVIEIVGFLMTIVISNLYRSKKAAKVAMYVQNVRNVQTALTSYYAMEGTYPGTINTIWLQFYDGRQIANLEYIGGTTADQQAGWNFFNSNSPEIQFNGPTQDEYALRSTEELLPYARYVYADVATSAKVVR